MSGIDTQYDWTGAFKKVLRLRNEAALVLHHDAITGTSRTTVVRDYQQRLTQGSNEIQSVSVDMLNILLSSQSKSKDVNEKFQQPSPFTSAQYALDVGQLKNDKQSYPIVVQNPLGWDRHDVVSVLLNDGNLPVRDLQVVDGQGRPIRAQIHATMDAINVHTSSPTANVRLFVEVRVPAMGVMTYYVRRASKQDRLEKKNLAEYVVTEIVEVEKSSGRVTMPQEKRGGLRGGGSEDEATFRRRSDWYPDVGKDESAVFSEVGGESADGDSCLHLKTNFLAVRFQKFSGSIESIHRKKNGQQEAITRSVSQQWMRYTSSRSGAYLFRPHGTASNLRGESDRVTIAVARGSLVQQVRYYASHVEQVTTLYNIKGPIGDVVHITPSSTADMNEEVVLRFKTNLVTGGNFYTDNGADLMLRRKESSKPTPANFYPMNAGMALRETLPKASTQNANQLMILNDHPMACASLHSDSLGSSMEMMVARSLRQDDGRGLAQGVHDSSRAVAPSYILLDESVRSQSKYRRYSQYLHHPLRTYLSAPSGNGAGATPVNTDTWRKDHTDSFAPMSTLPNGLHLLTFKAHFDVSNIHADASSKKTKFLVRLQSFANVKLLPTGGVLFRAFGASEVQETTLSFVEDLQSSSSKQLHYPSEKRTEEESELPKTMAGQKDGNDDDDGNQNTEEEGVFISAAALAKLEEDKKNGGSRRALLEVGSGGGGMFETPPFQIKSYKMILKYNPNGIVQQAVANSAAAKSNIIDPTVVITEAQKAAVADAANHQVGGVARGSEEASAAAAVSSSVAVKPTVPTKPTPLLPLLPLLPLPTQTQTQTQTQNAAVRRSVANVAVANADLIIPQSATVDGIQVPHRVKHATYGMTRQSGKSILGVELGFLGGVIFGLSMAVLCFLCWQAGQTKTNNSKSSKSSKSSKGSSKSSRSRSNASQRPDTGTPFRKSA